MIVVLLMMRISERSAMDVCEYLVQVAIWAHCCVPMAVTPT
jgi:hypothetical protein